MLGFFRVDYPEVDPAAWHKFVTVKQVNGKVVAGEKPMRYFGDMKAKYEANNKDYSGVYRGK
jgi:hypothetical protein